MSNTPEYTPDQPYSQLSDLDKSVAHVLAAGEQGGADADLRPIFAAMGEERTREFLHDCAAKLIFRDIFGRDPEL